MSHRFEEPLREPRAQIRVAPRRGHADHLKLGTGNRQGQRERIVDVVANIGIEDDLLLPAGRWLLRAKITPASRPNQGCQARDDQLFENSTFFHGSPGTSCALARNLDLNLLSDAKA